LPGRSASGHATYGPRARSRCRIHGRCGVGSGRGSGHRTLRSCSRGRCWAPSWSPTAWRGRHAHRGRRQLRGATRRSRDAEGCRDHHCRGGSAARLPPGSGGPLRRLSFSAGPTHRLWPWRGLQAARAAPHLGCPPASCRRRRNSSRTGDRSTGLTVPWCRRVASSRGR
jgi:hypothetical protein